jgi:hypothetical protein
LSWLFSLQSTTLRYAIGHRNGLDRVPEGLADVRAGARLCENADVFGRQACQLTARPVLGADRYHQSANAQNAHHPFHIVGQYVQRQFGADVLERFVWKCVDPIQDFIVPKGCSTVWRRRRILSGFRSSRACTASRTASCSQREIRRSLPVVHLTFSAHA